MQQEKSTQQETLFMQQEKAMQNDANMLLHAAIAPEFSLIGTALMAAIGAIACAIPVGIFVVAQTSTTASTKAAKDHAATMQSANTFQTQTFGHTSENAPLKFTLLAQTSNETSDNTKALLKLKLANRFQNAVAKTTIAELSTPAGQSAFAQKVCRDQIEGAAAFTSISCTIGPVQKF